MYFGSVKFFKHLIISIIGFIITALIAMLVIFILLYNKEREKATEAIAQYKEISSADKLNIPDDITLNQIYIKLKDKGFTTKEIVDVLAGYDSETMSDIYKNHFNPDGAKTENAYSSLYPDLYVTPPTEFISKDKTVYLTFDDGPSENTLLILSILEKYNIKATFFMCGSKSERDTEIMKKVAESGHSIGIHSLSHNYKGIYESVDSYLADFNNTYKNIYDSTGVKPNIFRFPGGSINNYDRLIYKQIIAETARRGFVYYDWNVSAEDADPNADWSSIYNHVMKGIDGKDRAIILMHDSDYKDSTVTVVEDLITELQAKGYSFDKITNDVMQTTFDYTN